VVAYRAITFVLPILLGAVCFLCWRWARSTTAAVVPQQAPVALAG
jgi:uncharacterized membrane protein YbhN (UPF0104 family)